MRIVVACCVAVGWLSLPVTALLLDQLVADLLVPIALVAAAVLSAAAGALLRSTVGPGVSAVRGAALGAVVGVLAAVMSCAVLFLLITDVPRGEQRQPVRSGARDLPAGLDVAVSARAVGGGRWGAAGGSLTRAGGPAAPESPRRGAGATAPCRREQNRGSAGMA